MRFKNPHKVNDWFRAVQRSEHQNILAKPFPKSQPRNLPRYKIQQYIFSHPKVITAEYLDYFGWIASASDNNFHFRLRKIRQTWRTFESRIFKNSFWSSITDTLDFCARNFRPKFSTHPLRHLYLFIDRFIFREPKSERRTLKSDYRKNWKNVAAN